METPKCKDCGQYMLEVGELAGDVQTGEMRETIEPIVGKINKWFSTGMRHPKLYQCPEDKTIAIY